MAAAAAEAVGLMLEVCMLSKRTNCVYGPRHCEGGQLNVRHNSLDTTRVLLFHTSETLSVCVCVCVRARRAPNSVCASLGPIEWPRWPSLHSKVASSRVEAKYKFNHNSIAPTHGLLLPRLC